MKKLLIFSAFCMIGVLHAASIVDEDDENIVIPRSLFDKSLVKYKARYDIVEILVPLNALNFDDSDESEGKTDSEDNFIKDMTIFFVEADFQNGQRVDKGLYVFKNGQVKNILPTGRTAATTSNDRKDVFFGASDGLFAYDSVSNSAVKYGPITDGIISIAADEAQNTVYILTDDHKLYNVSNNGFTKDFVSDVEDAQEIVLDDYHNIYYYNSYNNVFVRTADGVIQVQNLPQNPRSLKLIRPPFVLEDGVPLILDDSLYIVYSNGTSEAANLEFSSDARPTAYATEAVLIQYYAFNKKLYEYNFMQLMGQDIFEDIREKAENIHTLATNNKNTLGTRRA